MQEILLVIFQMLVMLCGDYKIVLLFHQSVSVKCSL